MNGVIISLKADELLYDIKSRAYVQGDATKGEDSHKTHLLQDIGDSANEDMLLRYMTLAVEDCKQMLYSYMREEVEDGYAVENVPEETKVYIFDLTMPHAVSKPSIELLVNQLHEYIVSRVIAEWCTIAYPEGATLWATRAEEYRKQIKSTHNRRIVPVRIRKHPY